MQPISSLEPLAPIYHRLITSSPPVMQIKFHFTKSTDIIIATFCEPAELLNYIVMICDGKKLGC